jgi:hypothetical protein
MVGKKIEYSESDSHARMDSPASADCVGTRAEGNE